MPWGLVGGDFVVALGEQDGAVAAFDAGEGGGGSVDFDLRVSCHSAIQRRCA